MMISAMNLLDEGEELGVVFAEGDETRELSRHDGKRTFSRTRVCDDVGESSNLLSDLARGALPPSLGT
jgi:hypothetical protein